MAGVDIFGLFPNSFMAGAVRAGLSRFRSIEGLEVPATINPSATEASVNTGTQVVIAGGISPGTGLSSGVITLSTPGVQNMAALLAAAGLSHSFSTLQAYIKTSAAGVTIAQGSGSAVYDQGSSVTFSGVSVLSNPVTITIAAGDVVVINYSGT